MSGAESIVAAARAAIGTRFRLHGRDADGVDCVGLVALAFGVAVPSGYRLRTYDLGGLEGAARSAGLVPVTTAHPGDLIVMEGGPRQLHLGVATDIGFVHADATLRRVVERPGLPPWRVLMCWRRED